MCFCRRENKLKFQSIFVENGLGMNRIININSLDPRVASFRLPAFKKVADAVKRANGKCIMPVHLGDSQEILFKGSRTARQNLDRLEYHTNYRPSSAEHNAFLVETYDYLSTSALPVFFIIDLFIPPDSFFDSFGNSAIGIPCCNVGTPKPKMNYALGHAFRFHWPALLYVMSFLGIKEIEFVGELFAHLVSDTYFPEETMSKSEWKDTLHPKTRQHLYLCVDAALMGLASAFRSTIQTSIKYPYTFPGLINIDPGKERRLGLAEYLALRTSLDT